MKQRWTFAAAAALAAIIAGGGRAMAAGPDPAAQLEQLDAATQGNLTVTQHPRTSLARFIGTDRAHAVAVATPTDASASPETVARAFLASYGAPFGVSDPAAELTLMKERVLDDRSFVRFQQVYKGIPVVGGELIVQTLTGNRVQYVTGQLAPDVQVNIVPRVTPEVAKEAALAAVARAQKVDPNTLQVSAPQLWIYNPTLLKPSLNLNTLTWRMEVKSTGLDPIRELVLVDALRGGVSLHFNQIADARNRIIYDNNNNTGAGLPGTGPYRTEGQGASGRIEVDRAYDYSGDTYDFYLANHGRDSIDGAGMSLINTVRYCPNAQNCPYQNAFWNGTQMVYGDGFAAADDVVGHELTHGVTEKESNLFYYFQSGAINESLSDVWGEFIDLGNGKGTDTPAVRWMMGEDVPGFGAIRNMKNPPQFGDPDRMKSSNYTCDPNETDEGGVHSNSGVLNKAVYLLADGASFNGKTVTGLGIYKLSRIMYEMATNFLTSASDYQVVYDTLQASCTNLIGLNGITASDCQQVKNAVDATEMNQQPTSCQAPEAPVCPAGQFPAVVFYDNIENAASGQWQKQTFTGSNAWYYPQAPNPFNFNGPYATSGKNNIWGYNQSTRSDSALAMTDQKTIPANGYLRFNHAYGFEDDAFDTYDGGVVEWSNNNGAGWANSDALPWDNGPNGFISNSYDNPLKGRKAFVGESNGYMSSRVSLATLAGQNVKFRFRIGTDTGYDGYGWFIDDVMIYGCKAPVKKVYAPVVRRK